MGCGFPFSFSTDPTKSTKVFLVYFGEANYNQQQILRQIRTSQNRRRGYMNILGSSQAVAGFPIIIPMSLDLMPCHAPCRASSTGCALMWSITSGMGIITVSQWQDREQLQESQVPNVQNYQQWKTSKKQ